MSVGETIAMVLTLGLPVVSAIVCLVIVIGVFVSDVRYPSICPDAERCKCKGFCVRYGMYGCPMGERLTEEDRRALKKKIDELDE